MSYIKAYINRYFWDMNRFRSDKYKALIVGGLVTIILSVILSQIGLLIVSIDSVTTPFYVTIHALGFLFGWLLLSFLFYQFPAYKIFGVLGLLLAAIIAEQYLKIPDNPITIPLTILFWLGVAYLVLPRLFKKYGTLIVSVYISIIAYFLFFRLTTANYAVYHRPVVSSLLLMVIFSMVVLWIYEQWRWLSNLQADKEKAELTLLKNQLNPHFFFNTLNNLYGLAVEKSEAAPSMILKLSDVMRYTIYEGKADQVSLIDEVAYLENYIELHQIRYQKKVRITFEKEISHSHPIAPLLLIVSLENAFKHGVEKLVEDAFIKLKISTSTDAIHFDIKNNYDPKSVNKKGIGLLNLKKRLALIYPNQHQLMIEKTADIFSLQLDIQIKKS
ncbi:MAG: sensor histidine kinase [Bacteroidota bacterium]